MFFAENAALLTAEGVLFAPTATAMFMSTIPVNRFVKAVENQPVFAANASFFISSVTILYNVNQPVMSLVNQQYHLASLASLPAAPASF
jgi:hypothetical protein